AVASLGRQGSEQALRVLSSCLKDWHATVRREAAAALHSLVPAGEACKKELPPATAAAASVALEALSPLALHGDAQAMAALIAALGSKPLRQHALAAVIRVATEADSIQSLSLAAKAADDAQVNSISREASGEEFVTVGEVDGGNFPFVTDRKQFGYFSREKEIEKDANFVRKTAPGTTIEKVLCFAVCQKAEVANDVLPLHGELASFQPLCGNLPSGGLWGLGSGSSAADTVLGTGMPTHIGTPNFAVRPPAAPVEGAN
ncbi:unnamed protein product, partial [Polarella glacialis]